MSIIENNWMYEPSTTGTNKDVETIIVGDTDSDYVKVVRCKDCKYHRGYCRHLELPFCPDDDFYCAYGERKET